MSNLIFRMNNCYKSNIVFQRVIINNNKNNLFIMAQFNLICNNIKS